VEHAALPLTAGGKLDRQALLTAAALPDPTQPPAAPRTPLEQALAAIWAAVLPVARVEIDDNFFALGGHSLRAVQVMARVRDQLGIDVPLRIIFEHPTVAGMAAQVQSLLDQAPPFEREEFVL
jgi:acyl carrier protein